MVHPVYLLSLRSKGSNCLYNWADGSLLGCKSHDTTNVTKIVGVINKVPWNSDLNAIDGKVWVIWNNVDIPPNWYRRYST
ncbi:hypothetical protein TNCT_730421 [Trichonephila clavata]|uniref:Uncharacterized protein n=1 Tax=Trichonephila clavata TaxID=2740835 RepID=A0A8X6L6X3_TRICU|nr:hypothetical protein TNCT_730421 [Trichonephila clavata]